MFKLILSFIALSLCLSAVFAHSWIDCTDYTEENGQYYSASKCRARPRNWAAHAAINAAFGGDTGYNHQDTSCKYALTGGNYQSFYTSSYPMATYRPGQRVCLAYPAKNHVAASCTNQYIPDTSNKIYYSNMNPSSDPGANDWKLLMDWGNNVAPATLENGGGKGFQNCPKFCENMDKALCTNCFTIPANTPEGRYAFQWRWVFNAGSAPYTSCWDAQITSTGTPVTPTPAPSTGSGSNNGGSTNNNNAPLVGNSIRVKSPPVKIPLNSQTVSLDVDYSANVKVDIVVDFLRLPDYAWFGKAIQKDVAPGTGTLTMSVKIQNSPTEGSYVLKPWIVEAGKAEVDKGWTLEMDRKEYSVQYTDKVVVGANSKGTNSAGRSVLSVMTLFAMIAVLLL